MWATFVIMPFLTFIISLRNIKLKQYRVFLLLFLSLYGYLFIPMTGADANSFIGSLKIFSSYSLNDLKTIISKTYTTDSYTDFYEPLLLFITTRFTSNYRIFFFIVNFIYFSVAFKLWETIWGLSKGNGFNYHSIFFWGTFFILGFSAGLNGVRWPLGFMVFSLGSLKYLLKNKIGYLLLAGLSVFIHYALLYPMIFLLLFTILKFSRKHNVTMLILIVVVIASSVISQFISSNVGLLGSSIQNELIGLSSEGYMNTRTTHISNWPWFLRINMFAARYFLISSLAFIYIRRSTLVFNDKANKLFLFVTLILIQCILSGNIIDPMTNNRYYLIFILFGLILLNHLGMINPTSKVLRMLSYIYIPILMLRALLLFRTDLYGINPILIFGNVLSILFPKSDINIMNFIFG